ncbi:MAG: TIR domain-containing protein [Pseudonocardiaceae bacterium]
MTDKLGASHGRLDVPGRAAGGSSEYDAFISYSHTLDGALARALQTGLERFAKPWYRPRALRVFRDTTKLAANPNLWSSIETALASSAWLVLMASPNAARSKWVNREVAWWLENKSPQRLLVVLTEGEFACDGGAGHADGTPAALPPALRDVFVEEPRWVDLRWLHDVDQVDQSNPRLRECVADVAATVHEVSKDALVGEHIRQHRRTLRLARGGVTALAMLLIAAVVAALIAVNQRNQAQTQRDTAIFNQIIAQADRVRSTDVSLAAQLDLTAYRMRPTPDLYTVLVTDANAALSTLLVGHTHVVTAVVFSPDGRTLATGSADNTVRLWDVTDPSRPTPLGQPLAGHTDYVRAVVFSPDGRTLASGGHDETVRLWDVTDPAHPTLLGRPLTDHTNAVHAVAFSPDGRTLASGSADQTVLLWNIPAQLLTGHIDTVWAVAFSLDGRTLATSGDDQTVRLWNVTDPTHPTPLGQPLTGHTGWVGAVAFSLDGRTLATGSGDQTVRLWNVTDPAHPTPLGQPLTGHTRYVAAVAFSPDGRTLASGSADQTVRLWDVTDPAHPTPLGQPLTGHTDYVHPMVLSRDGRTLATGGADRTVRLWNVTDPARPTALGEPLTDHTNAVNAIAFSPDGHTLASGGADQTVRLRNVTDPAHPIPLGQPLTGHTNFIAAMGFSPDGHTLVSGGADRTVRLWNVTDPAYAASRGQPLTGHTDTVHAVAFSPDGHTLASSSADQTVRLWEMNVDQAIQRICATTTNTLTPAKWKQYVSLDLPYRSPCS